MVKEEEKKEMLTPREWAKAHDTSYHTVISWLRRNWIPGVQKTQLPSGGWYYLIPKDAPKPNLKRGPKPKVKALPGLTQVKVLEALRKFAGDQLSDESMELIAQRHADYFFDLARQASEKFIGAEGNTWLDRLDYELDNLRVTLEYYRGAEAGAENELEFAVSLGHFWEIRGHWSEGREALNQALARQSPGNSSVKAQALAWVGYLSFRQNDYQTAKRVLSQSVEMSRAVDDKEGLAFSLKCLGIVTHAQGHHQEGKALLMESLAVSQIVGSDRLIGEAFHCLGLFAQSEGDITSAKNFLQKSLSSAEKIQDLRWIAAALNNLGGIAREEGDYSQARRYHELSLAYRQGVGNKNGVSYCYLDLGLDEEAVGQHQEARALFQKCLALCQETGNKLWMAKAMEGIARATQALGSEKDAARLYSAASTIRASINAPLSPSEQRQYGEAITLAKKKSRSDWNKGSRWPLDEAITYALSVNETAM
jgi:tetratricopeptide (TPR) repeat protein